MMKKGSLIDAFEVKKAPLKVNNISDYEVFSDKKLLDELRKKIIENIIDNKIVNKDTSDNFINDEIDHVLNGRDLTNLERSHIYNMIDNEINGYGPLNELLNDPNISEIMVNGPNEVYVEIDGKLLRDDTVSFINADHILRIIQKMVQPLFKTIDSDITLVQSR